MTIGRIPSVEGGIQPTIVDAKGDLIAGVAADSINRLAVGTNGTVLTADSSTSTGLTWTGVNQMANPVINGGMDIWQRGTSFTGQTATVASADRWFINPGSGGGNGYLSRQSTNDSTNLPNIQYCARFGRTAGNTSTSVFYLMNSFETVNSIPYAGKTITFSFYARAGANYSPTSNLLQVRVASGTGTDQNIALVAYTGVNYFVSSSATLTTTWQRFAFTGTVPSTTNELALFFQMEPTGTAGANDYFEVTGVQIDLGTYTASTAPTFRRSGGTIQGELAACQRYYFRYSNSSVNYPAFGMGSIVTTTVGSILINPPVTMRTVPTAIDFANVGLQEDFSGGIGAITSLAFESAAVNAGQIWVSATASGGGFTKYRPARIIGNNSSSAYVGFSAEL